MEGDFFGRPTRPTGIPARNGTLSPLGRPGVAGVHSSCGVSTIPEIMFLMMFSGASSFRRLAEEIRPALNGVGRRVSQPITPTPTDDNYASAPEPRMPASTTARVEVPERFVSTCLHQSATSCSRKGPMDM